MKKKKTTKLLPSTIRKIARLEKKLKDEKKLGDETILRVTREVVVQADKIKTLNKEAENRRDAHLESLTNWRKDTEALSEVRITKDRLKDQLGEQTFRQYVSLYLAQVRPHNFGVVLREFQDQHKGRPQTEVEVLVTVLDMVSNMPYLFILGE